LTSQRRENKRKDEGMHENRLRTRLTRTENTTRTRRQRQKKTRAQSEEECRRDEQISLGHDQTHDSGDHRVRQEEHERVEKDGHLISVTTGKLNRLAIRGEQKTWAERDKERGWDGDFARGNIGEHLIYSHIILWRV